MRVCKSLIKAKKSRQDEQKEKICNLEKELECLYEKIRELEHRIVQLEIYQKIGF